MKSKIIFFLLSTLSLVLCTEDLFDLAKCDLNVNNCDQFSFKRYRQNVTKVKNESVDHKLDKIDNFFSTNNGIHVEDVQNQENGNPN